MSAFGGKADIDCVLSLSHHLALSSARLTHVTSFGGQAIPIFEQLKFSPC
jgi:hypothetical protein